MFKTLREARGVGFATPQVNLPMQLVAIENAENFKKEEKKYEYKNPE